MSAESVLLHEFRDGVVTLTLNRPHQYNALSAALLSALQAALDDVARDGSARVVVLAGAGKAFCAGHDLKEMRGNPRREYYVELFARCSRLMTSIVRLPQPVIARVHGLATAAGCQLVAACDMAVAADGARFAVSGINWGLFCSTPAVALTRNVSRKRAFEMLVTGEFIDAQAASSYGLVNRVVPAENLDGAVGELADAVRSKSPLAVEIGKRMFYEQLEKSVGAAYEYAGDVMAGNMMAEDAAEGIDAFIEKRRPTWKGR